MNLVKKKFSMINILLLIINIITLIVVGFGKDFDSLGNLKYFVFGILAASLFALTVGFDKKISLKVKYFHINTTYLLINFIILGFLLFEQNVVIAIMFISLLLIFQIYFVASIIYFIIVTSKSDNKKNVLKIILKILVFVGIIVLMYLF